LGHAKSSGGHTLRWPSEWPQRDLCHRWKTLDFQGFSLRRAPGVSGFASVTICF
jgi:hypothetical protein